MFSQHKDVRVSIRMTQAEADAYKEGWKEDFWRKFTWTELIHRALSYYRDRFPIDELRKQTAAGTEANPAAKLGNSVATPKSTRRRPPKSPLQLSGNGKPAPTPNRKRGGK